MKNRGFKRQIQGIVTSDKMDKTVVVQVERIINHKIYKKVIRNLTKFSAHDEGNECKVGDKVIISESRPLSKTKRFRVSKIVEKAV